MCSSLGSADKSTVTKHVLSWVIAHYPSKWLLISVARHAHHNAMSGHTHLTHPEGMISCDIYKVIKKSLCTWWLQYRKLQVMFSVPRQSLDIYWHAELCSRRPCSECILWWPSSNHQLSDISITDRHYALSYITPLFDTQASTYFGIYVPSSGIFSCPRELLESRNVCVVCHILWKLSMRAAGQHNTRNHNNQFTPAINIHSTVRDKQHKRFCFQVTHEDIRSSMKMAHGCRNM
jgi:hypothetical protein